MTRRFCVAFFIGSQFAGRWRPLLRQRGCVPTDVRGGSRGVFGEFARRALTSKGLNKHETGVNWRKIKAEYIAGGISQRALAEKHGVPQSTLERRAKKEKWTAGRKKAEGKAIEKVTEKKAEAIADNAVLIEQAKTALLRRVVGMIEKYPDTGAQEVKTKRNGALLKYSLKDIATVLAVVEAKQDKGKATDIEDLAPLAELLRDEYNSHNSVGCVFTKAQNVH